MASGEVPAVTTALRGLVGFQVRLVTNRKELHSGLYGGAAANPVHDLVAVLASVAGHDQDFCGGHRAGHRRGARGLGLAADRARS